MRRLGCVLFCGFFLAKRLKEQKRLKEVEVWACFILLIIFLFLGKEVEGGKEVKRDMQVIYCSPLFLFTSFNLFAKILPLRYFIHRNCFLPAAFKTVNIIASQCFMFGISSFGSLPPHFKTAGFHFFSH